MKVAIGTDHNGPALKEEIINKLSDIAEFIDCSPVNDPLDDYPDFAYKVREMVVSKKADLGILICGTGIGMDIALNKVKGIRCAKASNEEEKTNYEMYYDYKEKLNQIPSHRILAINRGEKEEALKVMDKYTGDSAYMDRNIICMIYDNYEDLGINEARNLFDVPNELDDYIDYERLGEDLAESSDYYVLNDGRIILYQEL